VLPFHPKILVIMGGVNDFRGETDAWTTVQNLKTMGEKCERNGIIPVFATATPISPYVIALRGFLEMPREDWLDRQQYINQWVMSQKYAVDVSSMLADAEGNLKVGYTTDGLHPDYIAKKYIGETIGEYLLAQFPNIVK
ncbi:MAG: SGNH/GDSL hydrolase family protein, partial [Selenomonadaceae bacterium]|nr:SGNH/GDSL hydrolase family protein [Selenomonadaceae bacterium]